MYVKIGEGGGRNLSHKKVYSYSTKMFNGRAKPIRITNVWVSGVLLYLNTHTYIHTYIHTHAHIYTHTHAHIYTHAQ